MAISLVPGQADRGTASGASFGPSLPSNFTAGNLLILLCARLDNSGSELTVSDTVNGAYTLAISFDVGAAEKVFIYYVRNCLSGTNTCTGTWSGGVTISRREFFEFTAQSNTGSILTGHTSDASGTTHAQAVTGDHVSGGGLYCGVSAIALGNNVVFTPGWTHLASGALFDCIQYITQATIDETAPWSGDVSSNTVSALAFFPNAGASFNLVRP